MIPFGSDSDRLILDRRDDRGASTPLSMTKRKTKLDLTPPADEITSDERALFDVSASARPTLSTAALRLPGAEFRWCLRQWCIALRRDRTFLPDNL
jgi:hypothetical protein